MEYIIQAAKVFVALFIITDSLGNLPFFIGLTEGFSKEERRKAFAAALLTGIILLSFFAFAGALVFNLFEISIADIKIAGGLLLFILSIEIMLKGRVSLAHKEEVGYVPLGCPLLVGPGAITTVLVMVNLYNIYAVIAGALACFFCIWLILHFAEFIYQYLGRNGSLIITKISAIIIAAIAVRFIRQGVMVFLGM